MTGKGVNNFCDNFYNILGITLLNVCLSKWEREGASWCLLWILQKLPPNFSDTTSGRSDLMGVHWWAAARAESMSPTVRRMASVSGMMTSELLSSTAQLRHRVTSRHASHGPPSQHPQPGLPATLDLSLTSGLVSIEPIIHLHIFTPLHLQNSYSQTMSNVVMVFYLIRNPETDINQD